MLGSLFFVLLAYYLLALMVFSDLEPRGDAPATET